MLFGLRLQEDDDRRLWLVRIEVETGKKHAALTKKGGLVQEESWGEKAHITTPDGRRIEIKSDSTRVYVEVFDENGSRLDDGGKQLGEGAVLLRSSLVPERFRQKGFYATCREALRIQQTYGLQKGRDLDLPVEIARKISDETYETLANGVLAFFSLFKSIQDTRSLSPILNSVLEKPSLLSLVSHLGVTAEFGASFFLATPERNPLSPKGDVGAYSFPVEVKLNGSPALVCRLWVAPPEPLLSLCAGVVALEAVHPFRAEKRFSMHLLAARRGDPASRTP